MSTFSFTEKQSLLLCTLYFRKFHLAVFLLQKFHLAVFLLQKVSLGCIFARCNPCQGMILALLDDVILQHRI